MAERKPKVAKKRWVPIIAPKMFNLQVLGETNVFEPEAVVGKVLTINLMTLTKDMKKQGINVTFKVTEIKTDKAYAELVGFTMVPSSIKRLIRRGKDRVDEVFAVKTKDNVDVTLKMLLVTMFTVSRSVKSALRVALREKIAEVAKLSDYEQFLSDLLGGKLQRTIKDDLKKIYPLKFCDVRVAKKN